MTPTICEQSTVQMHFDIRLKDGSIAESSRQIGTPMTFVIGDGAFSPKMEAELLGLKVGDTKKIMLMPEDAFGEPHPANIFQVPRDRFEGTEFEQDIEPGLIIGFTQRNGDEIPGIVQAISEDEITVDFNHPLSGQVILFDVEIIKIS